MTLLARAVWVRMMPTSTMAAPIDDLDQVQALAEPQPGDQEGEDHLGWRSWQSRPARNQWCGRKRAMKGTYHANSEEQYAREDLHGDRRQFRDREGHGAGAGTDG